jgi:hypothetical protein
VLGVEPNKSQWKVTLLHPLQLVIIEPQINFTCSQNIWLRLQVQVQVCFTSVCGQVQPLDVALNMFIFMPVWIGLYGGVNETMPNADNGCLPLHAGRFPSFQLARGQYEAVQNISQRYADSSTGLPPTDYRTCPSTTCAAAPPASLETRPFVGTLQQ